MHRPVHAVESNCSVFRDRPLLIAVFVDVIIVAGRIQVAVAAGYELGRATGGEQTSERPARVAGVHCRSPTPTYIGRVRDGEAVGFISLDA